MTTVILYDSQYGNTQKIAQVIAESIQGKAVNPSEFQTDILNDLSLLIVGSPTHGGRPTQAMQDALSKIPAGALKNINVAAFDTSFEERRVNFALKLLMRIIGYAAPKIAKKLEQKGGKLVAPPEIFFVTAKEGPLKNGELERAKDWVKSL